MLENPEKESRIKELLEESRENGISEITYDLIYKGMKSILKHE